jgi:preprotein translocase subunit SecF
MEFFKTCPRIDFLGIRTWTTLLSVIICLASIISFFTYGLNLGLDFTGGTQLELSFDTPSDINWIRNTLQQTGLENSEVQNFGDSHTVIITLASEKQTASKPIETLNTEINQEEASSSSEPKTNISAQKSLQEKLIQTIMKVMPNAKIVRVDTIGSKVSSELTYKGILAVIVAILATMIYIAFRFAFRMSIGAMVALLHDPIVILGVFSFFQIPFDLTALAAVLTILGYSLHDAIIIYDRIRENFRKIRRGAPVEIVNGAINQTLSRTIISSGLTLSVVIALFFLGGSSIHAFSLALIIGILIGTYSSIYIAGVIAVALGLNRTDLLPPIKKTYDAVI